MAFKPTSLSELLQAYSTKGPGDIINAGKEGVVQGMDIASGREKQRNDFHNKLKELGILQQKADSDTSEAATKAGSLATHTIPANTTGIDSLQPLGDQGVDISVIESKLKGDSQHIRNQGVGPALGPDGKPIPGKWTEYVPGVDGGPGRLQTIDLPSGTAGVGLKNTPNAPASMVSDEGSIANQSGMVDQMEKMLGLGQFSSDKGALPEGGIKEGVKGLVSKIPLVGGTFAPDEKTYNSFLPAVATAVYRAQTGDTRLSDQDAAQRAYPLMPHLDDPRPVQESKIAVIRHLFQNRQATVQQQQGVSRNLPGAGITSPVTTGSNQPTTTRPPLDSFHR